MSQRTTRRRPAEGSASTSTNAADAPGDAVVLDAAGVAPRRQKNGKANGKARQADAAAPRQVAAARSAARLDDASDDDDEIDDGPRKDAKLLKLAMQLRANLLSGFFTPYDQFRAKIGVPRSAYEAIGKGTTGKLSSPAVVVEKAGALRELLNHDHVQCESVFSVNLRLFTPLNTGIGTTDRCNHGYLELEPFHEGAQLHASRHKPLPRALSTRRLSTQGGGPPRRWMRIACLNRDVCRASRLSCCPSQAIRYTVCLQQ